MQVAKNQAAKYCILLNTLKFFQKTLKKGIDKRKEMWYNSQAVRESVAAERSLKIEQQERSTKHCEVRKILDLVKELYILNKVKEAKN